MITYSLLALIMTVDSHVTTISWNPVPISEHLSAKECEHAFNDASGYPRRLTNSVKDYGWQRYNALYKCVKNLDKAE
jgi:hypothetical protein